MRSSLYHRALKWYGEQGSDIIVTNSMVDTGVVVQVEFVYVFLSVVWSLMDRLGHRAKESSVESFHKPVGLQV